MKTLTCPCGFMTQRDVELGEDAQKAIMEEIQQLIKVTWKSGDEDQFVHAIWYCVNSGTNRVEEKELEWINSLCSMGEAGVPVIVVITQAFRKNVANKLAETIHQELAGKPYYYGCFTVLATPDEEDPEGHPSFGLNDLVEATFRVIPDQKTGGVLSMPRESILR